MAGKQIGRVPLAGIPHHAVDRYCIQLVEKGFAIAICDQVEDPALAQGLVKREVTRVITPRHGAGGGYAQRQPEQLPRFRGDCRRPLGPLLRRCLHRGIPHHPGGPARPAEPGTDAAAARRGASAYGCPQLSGHAATGGNLRPTARLPAPPVLLHLPLPGTLQPQRSPPAAAAKVSPALSGGAGL